MGEQRRRDRAQHSAQSTAEQVILCEAEVLSKWGLKTEKEKRACLGEITAARRDVPIFPLEKKCLHNLPHQEWHG